MSRIMNAADQSALIRLAAALPKGDESRRVLLSRIKIALRLRQFEALMGMGKRFGVLSAYGPGSKNENQQRNGQLFGHLQSLGYRKIHPLRGSWQGVAEKSVLVPNMTFKDVVKLGRDFDQDSVIYKHPSGVIGMYYLKDGTAEFAVEEDGNLAAAWEANKSLYSKARGISFEFGFLWGQKVPWNGTTPYTKKGLTRLLESGQLSF
jgi:hypothetical protein